MQTKYRNVHKYYTVKYGMKKGNELFKTYMSHKKKPANKKSKPHFKLEDIHPLHESTHTRVVETHSSQNLLKFIKKK
jgi:hypothetical protein